MNLPILQAYQWAEPEFSPRNVAFQSLVSFHQQTLFAKASFRADSRHILESYVDMCILE